MTTEKTEKVVPEKDMMAQKARAEKAEKELAVSTAKVESLEVESRYRENSDPELLRKAREELAEKAIEVEQGRRALEEKTTAWENQKMEAARAAKLSEYGLSPEESEGLTDPKDIEIAGLRKKLEGVATTPTTTTPGASEKDVDTGPGGSAVSFGSDSEMDRASKMIEAAKKRNKG
uniref:Scaffolding protein n=1 Tax=viral metagenome TaxID=1070528 RepID=A0A6M3IIK4_9ZZZZ